MSEARTPSPSERLHELFLKLDSFFARAVSRSGEAITCAAGCDDCCRRRFSVTTIEAAAVQEALDRLPAEERQRVAARAADAAGTACPALGEDGRCAVYEARPTICRTHGLPIRFTERKGGRSLPVVDACPKNFVGQDLASLDPSTVLDQATLSTVLAALDAAYADAAGLPRGQRIEMTTLCSS
ncbi:YkgJ family cysteine cluster protein [Polyangium sp. y55x31]|uniref:YkgJ family cysteine cluster protein n=1 Tax=Polyangium sp. y55x31 TaxID=3042688 RepID=UPI002482F899|nr:YkgJ family cysteine cluster protein [Polyangium sp. y55x31]MDI1475170.1 YkgJ family cysteine cluster protein [Polyangium sp. y55x31]